MQIQLQQGKSSHYCFITDQGARAKGGKTPTRGQVSFLMEFVQFVKTDPLGDGENVPTGEKTLTVAELAAWWNDPVNAKWKVVDV